MTATVTQPKPKLANPDITQARLVSRAWDAEESSEFVLATIPSRTEDGRRHILRGHSHGRDAVCSCWGYQRWKRCAHASAWPLILEELEKQHYLDERRYSVEGLIALMDFYADSPTPLNDEQRLRRNGVKAALIARGVTPPVGRTLAERAARAQAELY